MVHGPAKFVLYCAVLLLLQFGALTITTQTPNVSDEKPAKEKMLFEAIDNSDFPAVQKLLASGLKVAEIRNEGEQSPLVVAADKAFDVDGVKILQALIDAGAD